MQDTPISGVLKKALSGLIAGWNLLFFLAVATIVFFLVPQSQFLRSSQVGRGLLVTVVLIQLYSIFGDSSHFVRKLAGVGVLLLCMGSCVFENAPGGLRELSSIGWLEALVVVVLFVLQIVLYWRYGRLLPKTRGLDDSPSVPGETKLTK